MLHPERDSQIDVGDTVAFTCVAYGNPPPHIYWERTNDNLTNSTRVSVRESVIYLRGVSFIKSTLEICGAFEGDSSEYKCTADNGLLNDSFSFDLHVNSQSKMKKPHSHALLITPFYSSL